jgi:hypothetical protein
VTRACAFAATCVLVLAAASTARATLEEVTVVKTSAGEAVIESATGERWRLQLDSECHFDWLGLEGRPVLVWSRLDQLGPDSRVLVPETDFTCAVGEVDSLARAKHPMSAMVEPVEGLQAMRRTLELLGYDCGPLSETGWTLDAAQAFRRFRESKRLDTSSQAMRRAITALALDGMRGRQPTGTSLRLSRIISDNLDALVAWLTRPGAAGARCGAPTWIRQVAADGSLVTLADGTRWQPRPEQQPIVGHWQSGDDVLVCSGRLIDARTGEMARAVPY